MSFVYSHPFTGLANGLNTMQGGGAVGGWVELGRTTLGSASDTITVSSLADKRYYMVLADLQPTGNVDEYFRLGNGSADTGSNYARRFSGDGGADGTGTSQAFVKIGINGSASLPRFHASYIANLSGNEKLAITHGVGPNTAGAGTAPSRRESVWKWVNTSNPLDVIQMGDDGGAGQYNTGSELVVLGWDPDDTHTNNFWEELASDSPTGSAGESMDVSFTAKKYLWVQWYIDADSPYSFSQMRVGNSTVDTGNNYARRYSINGAADGSSTSADKWDMNASTLNAGEQEFGNMFIINNASNEKLMMCWISGNNTGAGAANAPHRSEWVGKWANTSNQIDTIQMLTNGSDTKTSKSIIKVWGAD